MLTRKERRQAKQTMPAKHLGHLIPVELHHRLLSLGVLVLSSETKMVAMVLLSETKLEPMSKVLMESVVAKSSLGAKESKVEMGSMLAKELPVPASVVEEYLELLMAKES